MARPRQSAAHQWPSIARFIEAEARLADAAVARGPFQAALYEFIRFGVKQGWTCLFDGVMLALILATHAFYPAHATVAR